MLTVRLIVLTTSISIVGAGTPLSLRRQASPTATADAASKLLQAAANDIPRDTFDPLAIVKSVGKDRSALLAWVRDQTYWVPYRGALRGPTGVLMDRLGNSLDQSLLLAELLTLAGHTVRLAQGNLSDQGARDALQHLRPVPTDPVPVGTVDEALIERQARQLGVDLQVARATIRGKVQPFDSLKANLGGRVTTQAPFLAGQLGTRPAAVDSSAATVAAIRDHWWVEAREGAQWIDLDPMWPTARAVAGSFSATRTVAFDHQPGKIPLPSDMVHEVTVRVVVEQWKQGKVVEKTPVAHTFRPAETFGQPVVVQVAPLGWPKTPDILNEADPAAALKAILEEQKEWLPAITVGDRTILQSSFTETGELNTKPGQPLAAATAAVVSSINDAFGGGDAEPESHLTAAWIEYETRVPGRQVQRVRRDLFDLFNQKARSEADMPDPAPDQAMRAMRALALATAVQLLPVAAKPSREFVMTETISGILQNRDARLEMSRLAAAGDLAGAIGAAERLKLTVNGQLLDLAHARFEWSAVGQDIYLDAPNLLSYRTSLFQDDAGNLAARQGFDVVMNGVAIRPGATGDPVAIRLKQGIVDTNLEDMLMRGQTTGNAAALLDASHQQGWVTVRSSSDRGWARLDLAADVRARIEDQLRLGYVVVAPGESAVAAANGQVAWWRIDPRTGDTLGFGSLGWGKSLTEVALTLVTLSAVIFSICIIVEKASGRADAKPLKSLLECTCVGFGGGLTLTVALAGGGLAGSLFIASQVGLSCGGLIFGYGGSGSLAPRPTMFEQPATTCGPIAESGDS